MPPLQCFVIDVISMTSSNLDAEDMASIVERIEPTKWAELHHSIFMGALEESFDSHNILKTHYMTLHQRSTPLSPLLLGP